MQCAKGPFAKRPPADWDRIQKECPNIVRKVQDDNANDALSCTYSTNNNTHSNDRKSFINNEFASPFQNNFGYFNQQPFNVTNNANNNNNTFNTFPKINDGIINDKRPTINFNAFDKIMHYIN